jgi:hypothetical protein
MTTILDRLKAARSIVSNPQRWTQGATARNKYGRITTIYDPAAVKFCISGALQLQTNNFNLLMKMTREIEAQSGVYSIIELNDGLGRSEVMKALNRAIKRRERK